MLKIRTLCIFHQKASAYRRDFDKTMSFLKEHKKFCQKDIMKFGEKSATLSKKNLKASLYTMKNI